MENRMQVHIAHNNHELRIVYTLIVTMQVFQFDDNF